MVTMTHKHFISGPKIALFEPDIPQNTASIIRTCSCLGAHLEIIEPCGFLLSDRRFKRVVMDYLDKKMVTFYKDSEEFFAKKKDDRVILMTTKAKIGLDVFKFKKNDTVLFGRESAGVPETIHKRIKNKIRIPMEKNKRSLNLAVSVAITLAENLRQTKWIVK